MPTDRMPDVTIVDYTDAHAADFYTINAAWISAMFVLEPHDEHVLSHPRETILDPGGVILMARSAAHGVVGACALMRTGPGRFELTKMGVREDARGLKAGEVLLRAILARAATMEMATLYLLTSSKCAAALHLYEKLGFVHDVAILRDHGRTYSRCDVAMSWPLPR